ncbi:dihydroorotate dehydrogenase (quinone) [candidate division WWE3 bacterium]|nr:dihydroorotate dehydrogenase (quinone) [candidate division WWE3 bacterium]
MTHTTSNSLSFAKLSILSLATFGLLDAGYLSYEHATGTIPQCSVGFLASDCGSVLQSSYSQIFSIPLAYIGVIYYLTILTVTLLTLNPKTKFVDRLLYPISAGGFFASLYFMYLQIFVIGAICLFCTTSAFISTVIAGVIWLIMTRERVDTISFATKIGYQRVLKPLLFTHKPQTVHIGMTNVGELLGKCLITRTFMSWLYDYDSSKLCQAYHGVHFSSPVGLAAGFDYNAQLTQILESMGFGFQTIGTITNKPCQGNPDPQLGRLIQSQSLMVNKGFRNPGADTVITKLAKHEMFGQIGVSIGTTNTSDIQTVEDAVIDITETFKKFEHSTLSHSYYELNISCPNLQTSIDFYNVDNLSVLLQGVHKLNITRPIWVKMPISVTNDQFDAILETLAQEPLIVGIIVGNLQKDRTAEPLQADEVNQFTVGNFSGKPTWNRSNELISRAYGTYHERFTIIGCGGIFSAEDAYTKIRLGASLVQLITGMIFVGPQLIGSINLGLEELLQRDGFNHISQVIGIDTVKK